MLAAAAPRVEPAVAEAATYEAEATADAVQFVEAATCEDAPRVEAATTPTAAVARAGDTTTRTQHASASFAGYAAVLSGAPPKSFLQKLLSCCERDFVAFGEVKRYLVIEDGLLLIYGDSSDPKPLDSISLRGLTLVHEDPRRPHPQSTTISPTPNTNRPRESLCTFLLFRGRQLVRQVTIETQDDAARAERFEAAVMGVTKMSR